MKAAAPCRQFVLSAVATIAVVCGGCGSSPAAPTPTPTPTPTPNPGFCTFTVGDAPAGTIAAVGAEFTIPITTTAGCAWTASSSAPFVTLVGAASGTGSGSARFAVQPNNGEARQGTVQVAGRTLDIRQDAAPPQGCTYDVSPLDNTVASQGADLSLAVTLTSGTACGWAAVSNDGFITVKSGASGSGDGTVVLTVAANGGATRVGTATVAGRTVTILQNSETAPPIQCAFSVAPTQLNFGFSGTPLPVTVTQTSGIGCAWTAQSQSSFITIVSGATGVGNGTVSVSVSINTGPQRTGTVLIAGQTVTVTQAGAALNTPVAILTLRSDPGDYIGQGQSSTTDYPGSEVLLGSSNSGEIRLTLGPFGAWRLELNNGTGFGKVLPGLYENAPRFSFSPTGQPAFSFTGNGRGCNQSKSRFLISEAVYGPTDQLERLVMRFEQHCELWSAALHGELWLDFLGVTTQPPIPPFQTPSTPTTFFTYHSDPGDILGGGQSRTFTLADAKFLGRIHSSRPAVNITMQGNTLGTFANIDFEAPSGQVLLPGTYENAGAYPFQPAGTAGLAVLVGTGCQTLNGRFTVIEATYGPQGELLRFRATFEERCGTSTSWMRGEVYIVADPWR